MSDLRELYQEMILDHGKNPRHFGRPDHADGQAEGHNPLCGDRIKVWVALEGDRIGDVRFEGNGCAISVASASMMGDVLVGRTLAEAQRVFAAFHELVAGSEPPTEEALGKLVVFGGVREFPVRVKCATLAWHTLRAALDRPAGSADVSTE